MRLYFTWFGFYWQMFSPFQFQTNFNIKNWEDARQYHCNCFSHGAFTGKRNATHFRTNVYQQGRFVTGIRIQKDNKSLRVAG